MSLFGNSQYEELGCAYAIHLELTHFNMCLVKEPRIAPSLTIDLAMVVVSKMGFKVTTLTFGGLRMKLQTPYLDDFRELDNPSSHQHVLVFHCLPDSAIDIC
jgi:hypothetical protein